jgi:hypothetical protein
MRRQKSHKKIFRVLTVPEEERSAHISGIYR